MNFFTISLFDQSVIFFYFVLASIQANAWGSVTAASEQEQMTNERLPTGRPAC
jgi:hypothetical protein